MPRRTNETNKGGRPTKLDQAFCEKLERLVSQWDPFAKKGDRAKFIDYLRLCTQESIALEMDISRSTLNLYMRGESGFSDILKEILEHWETKRNSFHLIALAYWPKEKAASWIFLSKNFNRFTDEIKIGNIPGETFSIEETTRRVMQTDPDRIAEFIRRAQLKFAARSDSGENKH